MKTKVQLENEKKRLMNLLIFPAGDENDMYIRKEIDRIENLIRNNQFIHKKPFNKRYRR